MATYTVQSSLNVIHDKDPDISDAVERERESNNQVLAERERY